MSIKIGISSCLLGYPVRYDGGHKLDHYLRDTLGKFVTFIHVCPEVECGLPVPREAMRLVKVDEQIRLVTINTKIDYTEKMVEWAQEKIKDLEREELSGFIFKSKSPSSGLKSAKIYSKDGKLIETGKGLFAKIFTEHFPHIPVEEDGRLYNPQLRENFIERVFVYNMWKNMEKTGRQYKKLIDFHTSIKLTLLSHSEKHYKILGKMVAECKKDKDIFEKYFTIMMDALQLKATVKKHTNVLYHIMGYFKKFLNNDEKAELKTLIEHYHNGFIPLIVPITLINHYVKKFGVEYLQKQYYLNPHPIELMLRNHV